MPVGPTHEIKAGSWLGFYDWYLRAKLRAIAVLRLCVLVLVLHVLLAGGLWWYWYSQEVSRMGDYIHREFQAHQLPSLSVVAQFGAGAWQGYQAAFAQTSPVWVLFLLVWAWSAMRTRTLRRRRHLRGTRVEEQATLPARRSLADGLALGGVWLSRADEIRHVFSIGRPGVGKTVLFHAALDHLLARQEHAKLLIYDFKGDYLSRFGRANDLLFNPLDERSVSWNIFADLRTVMDIDAVCQSLIPESRDEEKFWIDSARAVFSGILHLCLHHRTCTNAAIWDWLTRPKEELVAALAAIPQGHRGWKAIEKPDSNQTHGVISTLMIYAKPFEYMTRCTGGWSVRDWVRQSGRSVLYVSNTPDFKDTIKPILSLCIDLLGRTLLSMPDDLTRRIYFILDEFGTLQKLSTVTDLLTLSRSKGGSVWLGIQDVGQLDRIYQKDVRQTIINACGNTAVFALADPETQQYVSDLIGDVEYEDPDLHQNIAGNAHGGFSLRRQEKTAPLMMPSELQSLPDLTCLIRASSSQGAWLRTTLDYHPRPIVCASFKPCPELVLPGAETASNA